MTPALPAAAETITVMYRGVPMTWMRIDTGWAHLCPAGCCRAWHHIDTESGTRHKITSAPGAPITVVASLWCPCVQDGARCSWHVHVTDGVAVDC